jgi:hypothetical protein
MPSTKKRFVFHADPALAAWLETKSQESGAPIAEIIRRGLDLCIRDVEAERKTGTGHVPQSATSLLRQPVLFAPKQETR